MGDAVAKHVWIYLLRSQWVYMHTEYLYMRACMFSHKWMFVYVAIAIAIAMY